MVLNDKESMQLIFFMFWIWPVGTIVGVVLAHIINFISMSFFKKRLM